MALISQFLAPVPDCPTFEELATRLKNPKFDGYVSRDRRSELLADLEAAAEWVAINGVIQACRNPDDDTFLEAALDAQANCIVTGDGDLLALGSFKEAAGFPESVPA